MKTFLLAFTLIATSAVAETQKVGSIVPLTGDFAKYGQNIVEAGESDLGCVGRRAN